MINLEIISGTIIGTIIGCPIGLLITHFIMKALGDWRLDKMVEDCKKKRESK